MSGGTATVAAIQRRWRSRPWDIFWRCVTVLGNELIYLVALPFLFWNVSVILTFHLVVIWAVGFYLGGALKNIFCLPRPLSPPVEKLESDYENEYGMPSTHAVSSFTLPVVIAVLLNWTSVQQGQYGDLLVPVGIALFFTVLVCFSRLYLGVHSPADLCGGILLGGVILASWFLTGLAPLIEDFSRWPSMAMPWVYIAITLVSLYLYPMKSMNNPSFADVAAINSTTCGIFVGGWQMNWVALTTGQYSAGSYSLILARSLTGYVGLVIGKVLLKFTLLFIARRIAGVHFQEPAHGQKLGLDQVAAQRDQCYAFPLSRAQETWLFITKFISYFYLGYFSVMGTKFLFPLLSLH